MIGMKKNLGTHMISVDGVWNLEKLNMKKEALEALYFGMTKMRRQLCVKYIAIQGMVTGYTDRSIYE